MIEFYKLAAMKNASISYTTTVLKFDKQGDKTGWTYIVIPADVAQQVNPGVKKSYRIKGKLDNYSFQGLSILPMGEGEFILPLNAAIRKAIGKKEGAMLKAEIQVDKSEYIMNEAFIDCLKDEPEAYKIFSTFPASHQRYYSKWIDTAKTDATKAKRIAIAVNSLIKKQNFGEMLRAQKKLI